MSVPQYYYSKGSVLALISSHSSGMGFRGGLFAREREKKYGLSFEGPLSPVDSFSPTRQKQHNAEGNSLYQLKILLNWKWKAGKKCIEIHLILRLVISFFFFFLSLSRDDWLAYLISSNISPSYLISGHRWNITVNIFCPEPHFSHHSSPSLPRSPNSIPPLSPRLRPTHSCS